ncbi:DUF6917 domain-containing protein [Amycolatopsis sulphurea]
MRAERTGGARQPHRPVGLLGFAAMTNAGVLDRVWAGGTLIGTVLGFDGCHFPRHSNVLIRADGSRTGEELGHRIVVGQA